MALDSRSLKRLRKRLPRTFMKSAQDKLIVKGRDLSKSYISQVVNGGRFDQGVIEVLIKVADEHQRQNARLAARARGKRKVLA